jgi:hypothetical protein
MTTLREAAQMALDALEQCVSTCLDQYSHEQVMSRPEHFMNQAMGALRAALAQPEQEPVATLFGSLPVYDVPTKQEPVAWMHNFIDEVVIAHRPVDLDRHPDRWTALYKDPTPCQTCEALARTVMMDQTSHDTPPQREWVGLTDEEIMEIAATPAAIPGEYVRSFAHAIEAKLREKNFDRPS